MTAHREVTEGTLPFRGYKVWYRIVGAEDSDKLPLLCLHGGPGAAHDYLEPLEALADTGRRVIFYDQLGCGNSDHPPDPSLWTVDLFLDEIGAVRDALGLKRLHLLGHSWGGMLAIEYALTRPESLASLILASAPASVPQYIEGARGFVNALPTETQQRLIKHEEAGTTDDPEYQEAMNEFYRLHLCRVEPWPECLMRTFEKFSQNPEVYNTMWGPSEFYATGLLKDWDRSGRVGEITAPTLITSGRYDEVTPESVEPVHRAIQGSTWVLFEESSHMPHIEEAERYASTVADFLATIEAA